MKAATDTITITRRGFQRALARCAKIFRDSGLEQEGFTPDEVELLTTVAVGFAEGLEAALFDDTDKDER